MYTGMCVKGPLDGVRLTTETVEYVAVMPDALTPWLPFPQDIKSDVSAVKHGYRFAPLNFVVGDELKETGLFLHESVQGLGSAIEHIFTTYGIYAVNGK